MSWSWSQVWGEYDLRLIMDKMEKAGRRYCGSIVGGHPLVREVRRVLEGRFNGVCFINQQDDSPYAHRRGEKAIVERFNEVESLVGFAGRAGLPVIFTVEVFVDGGEDAIGDRMLVVYRVPLLGCLLEGMEFWKKKEEG